MSSDTVPPLIRARRLARDRHLGDLFEAYETFCTFSHIPETWTQLLRHLALYLESNHVARPPRDSALTFRSRVSLHAYLARLTRQREQLGFLLSDAIIALFHSVHVLDLTQHFERFTNTLAIEVTLWEKDSTSQGQMLVRRYLNRLSSSDLYHLLDGLKTQIFDNGYDAGRQHVQLWCPCLDSHIAILAHLDIRYKKSDVAYLKSRFGYTAPARLSLIPESTSESAPSLFRRAAARWSDPTGSTDHGDPNIINSPPLLDIQENEPVQLHSEPWNDLQERSRRNTKRSSYSDFRSFVTALTHRSGSVKSASLMAAESRRSVTTFGSGNKRSTVETFVSYPASGAPNENLASISQWSSSLKEKHIIPDPMLENWSNGRGQHAEYLPGERDVIPLIVEYKLGETSSAIVESVRCMRIRLVRKVVRCNKATRLKRDEALQEVQQLHRAQHSHVVRLVGTYIIDDELAILTYPCADWNLEQFLAVEFLKPIAGEAKLAIDTFFTCLIKALDFLHSFPIKHMDIKPPNILVRSLHHSSINGSEQFKIYFTDFGSSRLYPSVEDSETDNWTPFTRNYAAQEVVLQERRGLSADIFSMGCVFAEMLATSLDWSASRDTLNHPPTFFQELRTVRSDSTGKPRPYYSKLDGVCDWLRLLPIYEPDLDAVRDWTIRMLHQDQDQRPSSREIADDPQLPFPCLSCTTRPGPEAFELASPPVEFGTHHYAQFHGVGLVK